MPSGRKAKGHWAGDRKQTTLWTIPNRDQDAETIHEPRSLSSACAGRCSTMHREGRRSMIPFSLRTSLIAAETSGRVCYGLELNPAYADVIVTRWQNSLDERRHSPAMTAASTP